MKNSIGLGFIHEIYLKVRYKEKWLKILYKFSYTWYNNISFNKDFYNMFNRNQQRHYVNCPVDSFTLYFSENISFLQNLYIWLCDVFKRSPVDLSREALRYTESSSAVAGEKRKEWHSLSKILSSSLNIRELKITPTFLSVKKKEKYLHMIIAQNTRWLFDHLPMVTCWAHCSEGQLSELLVFSLLIHLVNSHVLRYCDKHWNYKWKVTQATLNSHIL